MLLSAPESLRDNQSIVIVVNPLVALMKCSKSYDMTQRNVRAVYVGDVAQVSRGSDE